MATKRIQLINTILIVGTVSAVLFHYARFAFIGNHAPQFTSFLHPPVNIFCDFNSVYAGYVTLGVGAGNCYFPGVIILLHFFYMLAGTDPYFARELFLLIYTVLLAVYLNFSFNKENWLNRFQATFVWIFCNYAVLFSLHTANFEGVCFLLIAFAVWLRIKNHYVLSAILIGFAASIKIFPAIFLFTIMNKSNKIKCLLSFLISFIVCIFLPFLFTGSFVSSFMHWFHGAQVGIKTYHDMMMVSRIGEIFSHSMINAIRLFAGLSWNISGLINYYFSLVLPIILFLIYKIIKSPYIHTKVIIAACIICIFPVTSTDYKLLYFIIPLVLLCRSKRESKSEVTLCILIALLLVPKGYIYFFHQMYYNINTILNAGLLMTLLIVSSLKIKRVKIDNVDSLNLYLDVLCE